MARRGLLRRHVGDLLLSFGLAAGACCAPFRRMGSSGGTRSASPWGCDRGRARQVRPPRCAVARLDRGRHGIGLALLVFTGLRWAFRKKPHQRLVGRLTSARSRSSNTPAGSRVPREPRSCEPGRTTSSARFTLRLSSSARSSGTEGPVFDPAPPASRTPATGTRRLASCLPIPDRRGVDVPSESGEHRYPRIS